MKLRLLFGLNRVEKPFLSTPITECQYLDLFDGNAADSASKIAKAHQLALDIRKFEIDLYWKRASYFWVFTGAALTGYITVLTGEHVNNREDALLLISCLGLIFSVAWYFVNRASKFWQVNWEAHCDLLEDAVNGPIYKTVIDAKAFRFLNPAAPYSFSVTKINQLLSLFVAVIFFSLATQTLLHNYRLATGWRSTLFFPTFCIAFTIVALLAMYWLGRTGPKRKPVAFVPRSTEFAATKFPTNSP